MNPIAADFNFQKRVLWLNGAIPLALLAFDFFNGNLGANQPEAIIRTTGVVAIIFLVLTLLITPLAKVAHWPWLVRHRRWLGLWFFYYALVHLLAYSVFDKALNFLDIAIDIKKRPFILLGFLAFLLALPLALTSSNEMIKRLGGKRWKNLHRLTYLIAVLVPIHYWLIVKSDIFYPATCAAAIIILLSYRLIKRQ